MELTESRNFPKFASARQRFQFLQNVPGAATASEESNLNSLLLMVLLQSGQIFDNFSWSKLKLILPHNAARLFGVAGAKVQPLLIYTRQVE